MLHICTEHIQDSFCVSVCVWEHEFLPFRSQERQDRKGAEISKSGVMWSTSLAGLRAKSEERYCVHDQPPTSAGADSQNYTQDVVCPGMLCHGNSASLLGWWSHTFCTSVLDCAMRGLGEVISKIFCTLRTVEELTSLSSLFVSSIFPSWCLLRSWCVVPAVVLEDRGPHAEERAGHPKPPSASLPPSQLLPSSNTILDKYFRSQQRRSTLNDIPPFSHLR